MKLLLTLGLAVLPVFAVAKEPVIVDKSVACGDIKIVLKNLIEKYDEEPVWIGESKDDRSKYSLFLNNNGAWTLIQYRGNVACIIGAGENSEVVDLDPPPTI